MKPYLNLISVSFCFRYMCTSLNDIPYKIVSLSFPAIAQHGINVSLYRTHHSTLTTTSCHSAHRIISSWTTSTQGHQSPKLKVSGVGIRIQVRIPLGADKHITDPIRFGFGFSSRISAWGFAPVRVSHRGMTLHVERSRHTKNKQQISLRLVLPGPAPI